MSHLRLFPSDSPVLERSVTYADSEDSNLRSNVSTEKLNYCLTVQLRRELRELVGDDEIQLEIALRRAAGEPVRTTAIELGLDPATVSRRGARAFRQIRIGAVAKVTLALLARDGGATVNPTTCMPVRAATSGFGVSMKDYNQSFTSLPTWQQIANWLVRHLEEFTLPPSSGSALYVGAWHNQSAECWELDGTQILGTRELAWQVALEQGQSAYYDFKACRAVFV